jgi:uncharacterized repeat protein (TIGR03943 family)
MNKDTQSAVLLAFGAAGVTTSLTGTYSAYVKPSLLPYLLLASIVLVVIGLVPMVSDLLKRSEKEADDADADHGGNLVSWLLLLPTLVLMIITPPALGADAAARDTGVVTASDLELARMPPLPAEDPIRLTLLDIAMRSGFPDLGGLAGRQVEVLGFAEPRDDGGWYLSQITIACCAADAIAVKVDVQGAEAPAADSWAQVVGVLEETAAGQPPALVVQSLTAATEPELPYLLRGSTGLS